MPRGATRASVAVHAATRRAPTRHAFTTLEDGGERTIVTVGERQRLEILRVLYRGARALLLDEPTAVLSPLESDELYATLRKLADGGATVAVVTHRLDEVSRHADHVTVMRQGRVVLSRPQDRAGGADAGRQYSTPSRPPAGSTWLPPWPRRPIGRAFPEK